MESFIVFFLRTRPVSLFEKGVGRLSLLKDSQQILLLGQKISIASCSADEDWKKERPSKAPLAREDTLQAVWEADDSLPQAARR